MIPISVYPASTPGAPCDDCGAGAGAPCNDDCPTRTLLDHQLVLAELDDDLGACCPSPSYAAAVLCGCQGVPA